MDKPSTHDKSKHCPWCQGVILGALSSNIGERYPQSPIQIRFGVGCVSNESEPLMKGVGDIRKVEPDLKMKPVKGEIKGQLTMVLAAEAMSP